ncbi:MAG: hypothetical protein JWM46_664 [Candidatus Kaiserbacteria bacterium]|nr:hypothetical protein [Candidatus Kaiserbacteria bacterium]
MAERQLSLDLDHPRKKSSMPECDIHICPLWAGKMRYIIDGNGVHDYCSIKCAERIVQHHGLTVIGESPGTKTHSILHIGERTEYRG